MASCEPKKPSALRRLSEKNVNFARSVGRRLSSMLNLPVGYDMKNAKMMDNIPENEPSPQQRRRESVTVREYDDDKTFVSVYCQDGNILRKRLVDSSSQTDDVITVIKREKTESKPIKKGPLSFITSISIKSGISKSSGKKSGFSNPAFQSQSFDGAADRSHVLPTSADIIPYRADDVPRKRSASDRDVASAVFVAPHSARFLSARPKTPPTDYEYMNGMKRDTSFNDGELHATEADYFNTDSDFQEKLQGSIVQENEKLHDAIIQVDQSEQSIRYDVNDRVTPVEDYYESIQFVPKSKKLKRQTSTHV